MQGSKGDGRTLAAAAIAKIDRFYDQVTRKDYFELFSATRDTDSASLKARFHALAKEWHADAFSGIELGDAKAKLDTIFGTINEAFQTLSDPTKRAEYIVRIDRQKKGLSTDVATILRGEQLVDDALAKMRRKDWSGARADLEEAIRSNPEDPLFNVHLGWAIYHEGRSTEESAKRAIPILVGATRRQENLPLAHQYLGQIHFALGKADEAKKWWQRCLEWDPKNIEAARGIRIVNQRGTKKKAGFFAFIEKLLGKA